MYGNEKYKKLYGNQRCETINKALDNEMHRHEMEFSHRPKYAALIDFHFTPSIFPNEIV